MKKAKAIRTKILLTTIHQPLGVDNETCTKNIQAEMYHAQVTLAQGPFSIRTVCTGWGLEFIAVNLNTPTTVLHYPTKKQLIKELAQDYGYVGIGFSICTFPKAVELCSLVRTVAPKSKIVLGGYGTVLPECDQYADYVCREEGVNFFKRLLCEKKITSYKIPVIKRTIKVLSVSTGPEIILPTGLGCSRGCDFCCTSHFFKRHYYPLIRSGKEIHDFICSVDYGDSTYRDVGVIDEDFLADRRRAIEMAQWNAKEIEKPILFSCLTSLKSLSQYSRDELLSMGLAGVWVGIESKKATYAKLKGIDVAQSVTALKRSGISVLTSMIFGYDWHDANEIEDDFQYLLSLKPTLSQLMIYSPCPQTPLYEKLASENRLTKVPYQHYDGFHVLFKHPHFSAEELERLLLQLFQREYEELGPCIFRVLEVQLNGYDLLKEHLNALFRKRALEHQRFCMRFYPLLGIGIAKAPSQRVKDYVIGLRDRIESTFPISIADRSKKAIAPFLYHYTKVHDIVVRNQQPRPEIHRYHYAV
jgi:radical SAM superfamily enzyme YgiQ (UPF0313 family)